MGVEVRGVRGWGELGWRDECSLMVLGLNVEWVENFIVVGFSRAIGEPTRWFLLEAFFTG